MEQIIICINCPLGCRMKVTMTEEGDVQRVDGNTCPRGARYAFQECTLPLRMITAVIPVENSQTPLSVKTAEPVPKQLIPTVMNQLNQVHLLAPIAQGQVILQDVCGTGVSIVATRSLP